MKPATVYSADAPKGAWAARATLDANAPDGELLRIDGGSGPVLSLRRDGTQLRLTFHTQWNGAEGRFKKGQLFDFTLETPFAAGEWRSEWLNYAVRMYANGRLTDEEWPLGALPDGQWRVKHGAGITGFSFDAPSATTDDAETSMYGPMQFFRPPGHNTGAGDCMPFSRDGRYCLYYLFDRRGHRSKAGLGAHQWAQISSGDLKHWTVHPMAVGITEEWEGSICTGSLIKKDGRTYAFYAVRAADGSPARLTHAVSPDGVRYTKSHDSLALTAPYEPVSARDPMVFWGADGRYHMLVTTSLETKGRHDGCLAHLTSDDLAHWTQRDPFLVPGYADQPECSDYFEWRGWYYLVFSNYGTARYRLSRNPFGPWIKPANDVLGSLGVRVAKTADFHGRRLVSGFLCRHPPTYAGCIVTHELCQHADGTLGVKWAEEILPAAIRRVLVPEVDIQAPQGRNETPLYRGAPRFRLRANLAPSGDHSLYGLSLRFAAGREYRLDFDPARNLVQALRPNQDADGGEKHCQLAGIAGLDNPTGIDLMVYDDILDVVLSGGRALTLRLEPETGECELHAYAMWGGLKAATATLEELG
ncbi:MAG: glycosyl hydrolase [Lentisphaeria bacterium]